MKTLLLLIGCLILINLIKRFTGKASVPPPRIHLAPTQAGGRHAGAVAKYGKELEGCGFRKIGTYRPDPMKGIVLTAFGNPRESLCAIVYTHQVAGSFVDVVAKSESGRTFTATTAPAGQELDHREGHEKVYDKSMSVAAMVDLVLKRRPEGPWASWAHGNFVSQFEKAYADEMDWRAGRGGVTSDEVRRVAEAGGHKVSEGDILKATHKIQKEYAESRRDAR